MVPRWWVGLAPAILHRSIVSAEEYGMSDETDVVVEDQVEAVAVEPSPDASAAGEAETDAATPAESVSDEAEDPVVEVPAEKEPVAEAPVLDAPADAGRREAQLYLCERGHRTLILWGEPPATCNARKTRNEICGLTLYHSTELPEQVQKALNPIKASKKKSGKK
jgi:hypothetical protein